MRPCKHCGDAIENADKTCPSCGGEQEVPAQETRAPSCNPRIAAPKWLENATPDGCFMFGVLVLVGYLAGLLVGGDVGEWAGIGRQAGMFGGVVVCLSAVILGRIAFGYLLR